MASNIGFDDEHPFIEEGADEGRFVDGNRIAVTDEAVPETVGVTLERSVDGELWEMVVESTGASIVIDWESLSYGDTIYRATAFTAEGAATTAVVTVEARSNAVWLSAGDALELTGRLPFSPSVEVTAARQRALKRYAGRSLPVAVNGEAIERTVRVAGRTADRAVREHETANVDRLTEIAQSDAVVFMFRDPDGRRIYGAIADIQMQRQTPFRDAAGPNALWGYSFTLSETER